MFPGIIESEKVSQLLCPDLSRRFRRLSLPTKDGGVIVGSRIRRWAIPSSKYLNTTMKILPDCDSSISPGNCCD